MLYKQNDIKKYFNSISNKKISKKIIYKLIYERKFIGILYFGLIMLFIALIGNFISNNLMKPIYIFIVTFTYLGVVVIYINTNLENKEFDEYSLLNQQFYLLYLFQLYNNEYSYEKRHMEHIYSICDNYIYVLHKQNLKIRESNPFKITEDEVLIKKIIKDFKYKIKGSIIANNNNKEINEIIDIILNLNWLIIDYDISKDVNVNSRIEKLISNYNEIVDKLDRNDNEINKLPKIFQQIFIFLKRIVKSRIARYIIFTVLIITLFMYVCYRVNNSYDIQGIFVLALTAPTTLAILEGLIKNTSN